MFVELTPRPGGTECDFGQFFSPEKSGVSRFDEKEEKRKRIENRERKKE